MTQRQRNRRHQITLRSSMPLKRTLRRSHGPFLYITTPRRRRILVITRRLTTSSTRRLTLRIQSLRHSIQRPDRQRLTSHNTLRHFNNTLITLNTSHIRTRSLTQRIRTRSLHFTLLINSRNLRKPQSRRMRHLRQNTKRRRNLNPVSQSLQLSSIIRPSRIIPNSYNQRTRLVRTTQYTTTTRTNSIRGLTDIHNRRSPFASTKVVPH